MENVSMLRTLKKCSHGNSLVTVLGKLLTKDDPDIVMNSAGAIASLVMWLKSYTFSLNVAWETDLFKETFLRNVWLNLKINYKMRINILSTLLTTNHEDQRFMMLLSPFSRGAIRNVKNVLWGPCPPLLSLTLCDPMMFVSRWRALRAASGCWASQRCWGRCWRACLTCCAMPGRARSTRLPWSSPDWPCVRRPASACWANPWPPGLWVDLLSV